MNVTEWLQRHAHRWRKSSTSGDASRAPRCAASGTVPCTAYAIVLDARRVSSPDAPLGAPTRREIICWREFCAYVRNTSHTTPMQPVRFIAVPTLTIAVLLVAACRPAVGDGRRATAPMRVASGQAVGTLTLRDAPGQPLTIEGELAGLPAGTHGIHIHAVGQSDATGEVASAGPHLNPASRKHGLENAEGPHAGDLPNLVVGADGRAVVRMTTPRVTLGREAATLLDADGSAVVVHASADDKRTDPSGNSDARVECGEMPETT